MPLNILMLPVSLPVTSESLPTRLLLRMALCVRPLAMSVMLATARDILLIVSVARLEALCSPLVPPVAPMVSDPMSLANVETVLTTLPQVSDTLPNLS